MNKEKDELTFIIDNVPMTHYQRETLRKLRECFINYTGPQIYDINIDEMRSVTQEDVEYFKLLGAIVFETMGLMRMLSCPMGSGELRRRAMTAAATAFMAEAKSAGVTWNSMRERWEYANGNTIHTEAGKVPT